jgi:hypothetical protein
LKLAIKMFTDFEGGGAAGAGDAEDQADEREYRECVQSLICQPAKCQA